MSEKADPVPLDVLQRQAQADGRHCIVGALIANAEGRVFVMRRAPTRRLFPGGWDIVGGHVEMGESLADALAREIREETGWLLRRIVALVALFDWEAGGEMGGRREFDFQVEVTGDLERPHLEEHAFTAYHWVGLDDLDLMMENRAPDDTAIRDVVGRALEMGREGKG